MRSSHPVALLCQLLLIAQGCATGIDREKIFAVEYKIDDVTLEGVTRFSKDEVLEHIYIGESSWIPFTEPVYYSAAYRAVDAERIAKLYESVGYYNARVVDMRVVREDDEVDITIVVSEGEPVLIKEITYQWEAASDAPDPLDKALRARVQSAVPMERGAPFVIEEMEGGKNRARQILLTEGYPLAQVTVTAEVSPETLESWVSYRISPGRHARIGDIRIEGLSIVPRHLAQREIDGFEGEAYSPEVIGSIENNLYALEVFRSVVARPADAVGPDGTIDVTVDVREGAPKSLKVGLELGFEASRWEQRVLANHVNQNLFGNLTRLETRLSAGYAVLPAPWDIQAHGPVAELDIVLRKKGWLEEKLTWTVNPSFEVNIEEGYQYYSPAHRTGVSRFFFSRLQVALSHHIEFYDFYNISEQITLEDNLLGEDFRDPYFLGYVKTKLDLFLTDRVIDPRNGVILDLTYDLAGRYLGSQFNFHKITPGIRAYWQVTPRVQIAGMAETGLVFPYGSQAAVPITMKYYLGGGSSVRGWGWHRLSPKTEFCEDGEADDCRRIPIGGQTMVHGMFEVRVRVWGDLYAAAFADMGDVQPGETVYRPSEWNYTSGGGLRFDSPIGKFRLDFGARLNDTALSRGEDRFAFHLDLGEAF